MDDLSQKKLFYLFVLAALLVCLGKWANLKKIDPPTDTDTIQVKRTNVAPTNRQLSDYLLAQQAHSRLSKNHNATVFRRDTFYVSLQDSIAPLDSPIAFTRRFITPIDSAGNFIHEKIEVSNYIMEGKEYEVNGIVSIRE